MRFLRRRKKHTRLRLVLQTVVANIGDHADDFSVRLSIPAYGDVFSNRILAREEHLGGGLIKDRDLRAIDIVSVVEIPTSD
jgi:hypothetical protein